MTRERERSERERKEEKRCCSPHEKCFVFSFRLRRRSSSSRIPFFFTPPSLPTLNPILSIESFAQHSPQAWQYQHTGHQGEHQKGENERKDSSAEAVPCI